MFTGPGRPDSIVVVACRNASGSMSTRVGWKLRLTTGRTMFTKSAWKCLLISWNGTAVELRGRHVGGDRQQRRGIR